MAAAITESCNGIAAMLFASAAMGTAIGTSAVRRIDGMAIVPRDWNPIPEKHMAQRINLQPAGQKAEKTKTGEPSERAPGGGTTWWWGLLGPAAAVVPASRGAS